MRGFGTIYHGIAVALHSVKHMRKSSLQVPISIFWGSRFGCVSGRRSPGRHHWITGHI